MPRIGPASAARRGTEARRRRDCPVVRHFERQWCGTAGSHGRGSLPTRPPVPVHPDGAVVAAVAGGVEKDDAQLRIVEAVLGLAIVA